MLRFITVDTGQWHAGALADAHLPDHVGLGVDALHDTFAVLHTISRVFPMSKTSPAQWPDLRAD